MIWLCTVRPLDTRPQAARTLTMHDSEFGPKIFEIHLVQFQEESSRLDYPFLTCDSISLCKSHNVLIFL